MAGTKVSALTAGAALGGTEAIPAVQSAATVKITAAQIKTFVSASPTLVTPVLGVATGTSLALGNGTSSVPSITLGDATTGFYRNASSQWTFMSGGSTNLFSIFVNGGTAFFRQGSNGLLAWTASDSVASADAGVSRVSAGVIGVGTGALGSVAGTVSAGGYLLASGTAIPAGGTAGLGYRVSSTANFGVFFGSGAPTLSAAKGSLYLRSDGSTTNDRAYINTDGGTTWTALTTAA